MNLTIGAWRISIQKALPPRDKLAKIYNSTNWYWDSAIHRLVFGRAYLQLFRRLIKENRLTTLQNKSKILDGGIGAGLFIEALIRATGNRYQIFGIDISERLLKRARRNLSSFNSEVTLESGDIHQLPFSGGEMDLVISALALEHAQNPAAVIREMSRVLSRNSTMILVAVLPSSPDFFSRLFYRYTPLPPNKIVKWMKDEGLCDIQFIRLSGTARLFGCAFVGKKI